MATKNTAPPVPDWQRFGTRLSVSETASGRNELVAAQGAGKRIRLLAWSLTLNGACNLRWESGTTDKSGLFIFGGAGLWEPPTFQPLLLMDDNEALNLNMSASVTVSGAIWYEVVG